MFLCGSRTGDSFREGEADGVFAVIPAELRADVEVLRILLEKKDRGLRQMKKVPRDRQDSLQDLVKIKGRQDGLAGRAVLLRLCSLEDRRIGRAGGL